VSRFCKVWAYGFLVDIVCRIITTNDNVVFSAPRIEESDAGDVKSFLDQCYARASRDRKLDDLHDELHCKGDTHFTVRLGIKICGCDNLERHLDSA
jgi:hypothetical protein